MNENVIVSDQLQGARSLRDLRNLLSKSEFVFHDSKRCAECGTDFGNGDSLSEEVSLDLHSGPSLPEDVTVTMLKCRTCNKYCALWCCGRWCSFEEFLNFDGHVQEEFTRVRSPADHLIVFVLSQVCYNQQDIELSYGESPFLPNSHSDRSKLIWKNNEAVGFYTIKQKGSAYPGYPLSSYSLNMLDAIYVRRKWRHLGLASHAISDFISEFPNEDLGFSDPVSQSLLGVLWRYLSGCPKMCDHFWVCSYTGEPGYRWNVYLQMKTAKWKEKTQAAKKTSGLALKQLM